MEKSKFMVHHWILYFVWEAEDSYYAFRVPAGDTHSLSELDFDSGFVSNKPRGGTYTRSEVTEMAIRLGYKQIAIDSAFILADAKVPIDECILSQIRDSDYESLVLQVSSALLRSKSPHELTFSLEITM